MKHIKFVIVGLLGIMTTNVLFCMQIWNESTSDLLIEQNNNGIIFKQVLPRESHVGMDVKNGIKITPKGDSGTTDYIKFTKSISDIESHGRLVGRCDRYNQCKIRFIDQK